MKKRLIAVILAVVVLSFSGCRGKTSDYEEPENRLYISALGFDRSGEKIRVCAEAISIKDNATGDEYAIKHYEGEGDSVESAMHQITKNLVPAVNLSHCALVVLGENMLGEYLNEFILYCFEDREITQSIQLISSDNAKELLQHNKENTKPIGFQISDFLSEDTDGTGMNKSSTLISVMNNREKEEDFFALPYFTVENKTYLFSGARVYKGGFPVCELDRTEMQLLKIAENKFRGGEIMIETEPQSRVFNIVSAKSSAAFEDGEEFKYRLSIKIKTDNANKSTEEIGDKIQKDIKGLIIKMRDNFSVDPLGIEKLIKTKYKSLDYEKRFALWRKAEIIVDCEIIKKGEK